MILWILWMLCAVSLLAQKGFTELTIKGCEEGRVDVVEDSSYSFTCDLYYRQGPDWTIYGDKRQLLYTGSCQQRLCTSSNDKFILDELYQGWDNGHYYTSRLTIRGIKRDSARILRCSFATQSTECKLRIIAIPVYEYRSCSVSISNWIVTGRCTVTGMYSSDNNYSCKWSESRNSEEFGGFETKSVSDTASNSRNYTEGNCSFTKPMPLTNGYYTYTMRVSPGDVYFQDTINIVAPYQVKLNHSCPRYVLEGSSVNCTCYTSTISNPPALTVWEGRNNARLLLTNVTRRLNQERFTCRLEWGRDGSTEKNASFTLTVAYGPLETKITSYIRTTDDEPETILFICTAIGVYPSAVFQWNVTCYNQTDYGDSSTCSLNLTHKFESLAILCTASNKYFPSANVSHVYVLSSLGNKQTRTAGSNSGLTGGIIAAVLVVLIIVVVLIVFLIKRRKDRGEGFLGIFPGARKLFHQGPTLSKPHDVDNEQQTQTPIKRQAAPSGDLYTLTSTTSSGHVVDEYATVCKTSHNNTMGTESTDARITVPKTQAMREPTAALKPATKPKPTTANKMNVQDLHGTGYMNVTEVPTDSGLGVYHVVPWATTSGSAEPHTNEYHVPTISEEEYNELHFVKDRTGQDDQGDNYHHLQITYLFVSFVVELISNEIFCVWTLFCKTFVI